MAKCLLIFDFQVKCSGQRSGCDRCRFKAFTCVYGKPKRQPKFQNSTSAPTEPILTNPAAPSNDAEFAAKPPHDLFQFDQTTSGRDLSPTLQGVVDHELGAAADPQDPGILNDLEVNAAFDALCNTHTIGAHSGLDYEDDHMMRSRDSPLDPCAESRHRPMFSLNTASLQELIDSDDESAAADQDSPSEEAGVGKKYLFMTLQIPCLPAHH